MSSIAERRAFDEYNAVADAALFDIKRFAIHDGPGIRTTIFLKGCPLQCAWCHNPESQAAAPEIMFLAARCTSSGSCVASCPQQAIQIGPQGAQTDRDRCIGCGSCVAACESNARSLVGKHMSLVELLAEIESDIAFFDESGGGVTLSGGEPLSQPELLVELLSECKARKIHTALDTCGLAPWETLRLASQSADLILFDLKCLDEALHTQWTGQTNRQILDNLRRLDEMQQSLWIRIPFIPEMDVSLDQWQEMGKFIASLSCVEAVHLLPYHRGGESKHQQLERALAEKFNVPTQEDVLAAANCISKVSGLAVRIGG